MFNDDTRKRLEDIVNGVVLEGRGDNCTAAQNLLCASFRTSTTVKKDFEGQFKYTIFHRYSILYGIRVIDISRQELQIIPSPV